MPQLRVGHSDYHIEDRYLVDPPFLCRNGVSLSTFGGRFGGDVCAEWLFGHIVACGGVGPGPASAAELPASTRQVGRRTL